MPELLTTQVAPEPHVDEDVDERDAVAAPDGASAESDDAEPSAGTTDSATRADVAERLTLVISRLSRRIRPVGDELSHGLLSALSSVKNQGPVRPSDLARLENVAAPTMTRIVAELENRGLIQREADPVDGRSFLLSATPSGLGAISEARSSRTERVLDMLRAQSDDDISAISAALPALEAAATSPS